MRKILILGFFVVPITLNAQQLVLKNEFVQRVLQFDGKVWRTTKFANGKGDNSLLVKSNEVNILPLNASKGYDLSYFSTSKKPVKYVKGDTSFISISYQPLPSSKGLEAMPDGMDIKYFLIKGQPYIRKTVTLNYNKPATVDRLETERFLTVKNAEGGGRGEPVFVNNQWFFGIEYPASYSRHTDGNTPESYGRTYDKVGNYSDINLEGRDIEPNSQKGMIRLMHFPGYAQQHKKSGYQITSKTTVAGVVQKQESTQTAFMTYLSTVWKAPRSFLHYNNWFEPKAKDLKGDGLLNIWRNYKAAISPYGVKMDAMVVDDGWQDRKSIWEPSKAHFPNGYADVSLLSNKLKSEGVGFGLWLSLNGYTNNIDWGKEHGYKEAKRNPYFSRYGRNYSLSATKYKEEVLKKIPEIAKQTGTSYYKHDFNVLSDLDDNNHPPTDRHGHEATLDATIEILLATKKMNPEIHQNLTNWIWFSPWWLMYADYVWMLAGDDGTNGNWPEISTRAMASTDRDTYIWRMFGNPADRPLVPISYLMTHGIIKTTTGMMESVEDNLQDWAEYVLMHYGRGTLLKEWYISPSVMKAEDWEVLCKVDNWARINREKLNNTVFVGGRPDEGNAYGYIGWKGEKAVLVARNTRATAQTLVIPFNQSVGYNGRVGIGFKANVVFPYQDQYSQAFVSGKDIKIELPGYSTMAIEFETGSLGKVRKPLSEIQFETVKAMNNSTQTMLTVPKDVKGRCDLLLIGHPTVPVIKINGEAPKGTRSSKAKINNFAGYAKWGMASKTASAWTMFTFDLLPYAGKSITISYDKDSGFESFILAEREISSAEAKRGNDILWVGTNQTRRQTVKLF